MGRYSRNPSALRGFTLIELVAVMIVLAILAGVAMPKFFDYSDRAKTAALQGTLGNVRAALSNFYANAAVAGTPAYPTLAQLTTTGTVLQDAFPQNPYNSLASVSAGTLANWNAREVAGSVGWRYYVDNTTDPPESGFWANTSGDTTAADPAGGVFQANEL